MSSNISRVMYLCSFLIMLSAQAIAQDAESGVVPGVVNTEAKKTEPAKPAAKKSTAADKPASDEKKPAMVQQATLNNLQMTVTGNQEQPRVLYILPWQSPATTDVDFEPLDSEQKAVFSHVEREELRRELESVGEGE